MSDDPDPAYLEQKHQERLARGQTKAERLIKERLEYKMSQKELLSHLESPKARYQSSVQSFIASKNAKYLSNPNQTYCTTCWSGMKACVCDKLKKITTRHRYINWLHHKEVWRTTNTGCLLPHSCDNAKILIHGVPADDDYLDALFRDEFAYTVILYPSPGSISLQEFFERRRTAEEGPITDWKEFLKTAPILNVIGVDSTWSQSRAMGGGVPDTVARVHLTDPPQFSVSRMRNQGSSGRITTAEAFAAVMKELGESEEAVEGLLYNLALRCEALAIMGGTAAKEKAQSKPSVELKLEREEANRQKRAEKKAQRAAIVAARASSSAGEAQDTPTQ